MMIKKNDIKKFWKKFWYIIWQDESLKGWIISLVVLFIFIKFLFFPTLSLATGTHLPMAIVESCSMYHDGNLLSNYDKWWNRHESKYEELGITEEKFKKFIFNDGFNKGDILFVIGANPEKLKIGDVIIFNAGQENPIIHRIIDIKRKDGEYIFSTIGDNNNGQLSAEKEIREEQIIGKAVFKLVPYAGWGKLIFFEYAKPSGERGLCSEN
jgi:signal peptidase I